jgi:hypothetical protein
MKTMEKLLQIKINEKAIKKLDEKCKVYGISRRALLELFILKGELEVHINKTPGDYTKEEMITPSYTELNKKVESIPDCESEEVQVRQKDTLERIKERVAKKKRREEIKLILESENLSDYQKVRGLMNLELGKAQEYARDYANGNDIPEEYVNIVDKQYQGAILEGFKLLIEEDE